MWSDLLWDYKCTSATFHCLFARLQHTDSYLQEVVRSRRLFPFQPLKMSGWAGCGGLCLNMQVILYDINLLPQTNNVDLLETFSKAQIFVYWWDFIVCKMCTLKKTVIIEIKLGPSVHFSATVCSICLTTHNLPSYCNLFLSNYTIITEVMRQSFTEFPWSEYN